MLASLVRNTTALFFIVTLLFPVTSIAKQQFREDTSAETATGKLKVGSHVKVYLPNLPYIASSHSINGALFRPANNELGWEYDMAVSHEIINPTLYEFTLRQGVRFQDGTPFDADAVLLNMEYFVKEPYTFTKLHRILTKVEKVSQYKVRFHLSEDYGLLLYDAIWLQFYTEAYLKKHGWNGKPFCPNLAEAGPYGLGPYILKEGYIEGNRRSDIAILERNPYYWDPDAAKVEKVTLYMGMTQQEAKDKALHSEGEIDISPVLFSDELEAIFAPYSKTTRLQSTNTYIARFNLFTGNPIFQEREVREIVNSLIDQKSLVSLSMNGEGRPTYVSIPEQFYGMSKALEQIEAHQPSTTGLNLAAMRERLNEYKVKYGYQQSQKIPLRFLAQESMRYMLNDIKFYLEKFDFEVQLIIADSESAMFASAIGARSQSNDIDFDLVLWPNFDWLRNPWVSFFIFDTSSVWSTTAPEKNLDKLINDFIATPYTSEEYIGRLRDLLTHIRYMNYQLNLPSPFNIIALNKEVIFQPRTSAVFPLWEIQVSDLHWSIRKESAYPEELKVPIKVIASGDE
ncbi:putative periplasmic binding protein [Vibrio orientalis CIP 102891 = ATCC 33934]|uniref:Periplasmic binding protein n=1 Tax=Vibrio orientalis CIP 102891 = ATCC 33934 TaxID=675816 RepID=C9QFG7_VIBOR|nr:ABC transporter substrate-binding protein [Vibrio orientalis]EEX94003.1 putative periplasmic binding protein [Vibrio orientalis CIP 102891 = ATCC 33934]EGU52855.1 putative periplasmic binding protein [Vibrio orientalis CIP 102891 = ATCC 33934]